MTLRALAGAAALGAVASGCRGWGRRETVDRADAAPTVFEAEATLVDATGAGAPITEAWCASGRRAVQIAAGEERRFELAERGERVLWLRVACAGGAELEVGAEAAALASPTSLVPVAAPDTLHGERFEWLCAGPLAASDASRALVVVERSGAPLAIDQWALLRAGEAPAAAWSPPSWRSRDGSIELRAAADARVADPEWVLLVAREQRDAVAARFVGADPAPRRPLVLVALPASGWPRAVAGAFQNGCAIFLRDDELHLPWRSYAHELAHLHEEARGRTLPWFLSEGIACAIALEVEAQILGDAGPVAAKEAALDSLLKAGDGWHRPGASAPNAVFLLDADPRGEADLAAAHGWSTALLRGAARRGGAEFWRRLDAAIAQEPSLNRAASDAAPPPGTLPDGATRLQALEAAGRALRSAAGAPLDELLAQVGWPLPAAR